MPAFDLQTGRIAFPAPTPARSERLSRAWSMLNDIADPSGDKPGDLPDALKTVIADWELSRQPRRRERARRSVD